MNVKDVESQHQLRFVKRVKLRILLNIVNEILDSSKIESGMMEIVPVNYEMGSLLNDLYNMSNIKKILSDIDGKS